MKPVAEARDLKIIDPAVPAHTPLHSILTGNTVFARVVEVTTLNATLLLKANAPNRHAPIPFSKVVVMIAVAVLVAVELFCTRISHAT